jgi:putative DNA primase/helicase
MAATRPAARKGEALAGRPPAQAVDNQADPPRGEPAPRAPEDAFAREEAPAPFEGADFRPPAPDVADAPAAPRVLDYSWKEPLARQVTGWLRLLVGDGQAVELRALNVASPGGARLTWSGFFAPDALGLMAEQALELTADAEGVYVTVNPLDPSLLARRYNRVEVARDTSADADVVRRRWLLVDADPVRKSGISATNEEKGRAWQTARSVYGWLRGRGWPEPVLADSGNGYHLLYRIELPADDGGLVKSVLEALAARFDTAAVKIDTKVFNPGRIVKLYGTVARKGDSIRERPHRRTGVLAAPGEVGVVSREQLESAAGEKAAPPPKAPAPAATGPLAAGARSDLVRRARSYLAKVPPAVSGEGGHNQTFKAACALLRLGLTQEEAMAPFREWNERCQPPWREKDLRKKLRDADRKVRAQAAAPAGAQGGEGGGGEAGAADLPALNALEAADDPHRLAQLYLAGGKADDGEVTVRCWNGDWYCWDGPAYRQVPETDVRAGLTRAIKGEFDRISVLDQVIAAVPGGEEGRAGDGRLRARKVTTTLVGNALQALKSETFVRGDVEPPAWLGGEGPAPARELLVARNGLVHLPALMEGREGKWPLTPRLFTTVALDYAIERDAAPPAGWLRFLEALWPGDAESVGLLQEWFGYCLTADTSQQKILLVVGPKRAGKGTIARVLTALVGQANVAGPTLGSLASNFGLAQLLNKPVAVISDARFSGRAAEQAVVVERLLSISGEDTLTIDRKNREHLTVRLPTRFTILTNELPRLTDASGALPSRLLILQLGNSWYGKEDTGLGERLLAERPGVLLWAVEGLRRLRSRGRFQQPASGEETASRLVELSSPVTAFVQERCELGPKNSVVKADAVRGVADLVRELGARAREPGDLRAEPDGRVPRHPDLPPARGGGAGGELRRDRLAAALTGGLIGRSGGRSGVGQGSGQGKGRRKS